MSIRPLRSLLLASFTLLASPALALNTFLRDDGTFATVPGTITTCATNTVAGNSGAGLACLTAPVLQGTFQFLAPAASSGAANGIVDTTATIASQSAFWSGYGVGGATLGNPVVHRFNRMLVGEFSGKSTGCHTGSQSWLHTFYSSDCESGQIAVTSTLGTFGIVAGVRTSDFRTWKGAATQGSSAGSFFGINDDTGAGGPIMDTINVEAVAVAGVTGATMDAQFNLNNLAANHITDPFIGFNSANLLLTPGVTSPLVGAHNVDAAIIVGNSSGAGTRFNTGINMQDDAVQINAGPTVNGVASTVGMALSSRYAVVWYSGANTASAAIYSGTANKLTLWAASDINLQAANGSGTIVLNPGGGGGITINNVAGASCGPGSPSGGFQTINGIVVAC